MVLEVERPLVGRPLVSGMAGRLPFNFVFNTTASESSDGRIVFEALSYTIGLGFERLVTDVDDFGDRAVCLGRLSICIEGTSTDTSLSNEKTWQISRSMGSIGVMYARGCSAILARI